ncbi:MAG TPA: hypothetical protein PKC80_00870 [Burkholderiaceae bacterium]|nr:hypothetical protein [Burkholderiaceae bacterium]
MNTLILQISKQHPTFAGHFPDAPIVPGVVLLDTALQAIAAAENLLLHHYELNSVKFLSPLSPADSENTDQADIHVSLNYQRTAEQRIQFDIVCGERKIVNATINIITKAMA